MTVFWHGPRHEDVTLHTKSDWDGLAKRPLLSATYELVFVLLVFRVIWLIDTGNYISKDRHSFTTILVYFDVAEGLANDMGLQSTRRLRACALRPHTVSLSIALSVSSLVPRSWIM